MKKEEKLYLLLLQIHSDGDFYWKLKSFPEEKDELGDRMDEVCIYLKNPTEDDIKKILNQIADEFEESFDSHREYIMQLKDKYIKAFKNVNNIRDLIEYGEFGHDFGNQSLEVKLIPYIHSKIKVHNTNESMYIGQFNVKYCNLL